MKKFIFSAVALAIPAMMWGFDVHFFNNSASAPVASHTNATKVLFGESAATVVLDNGETHNVNLSQFDYFSFANNSGVQNIVADNGVEIYLAGRTLCVKSDKTIKSIQVVATNGAVVATCSPSFADATLQLDQLQSGIYIVSVTSERNVTVKKVILK